MRAKTEQVLKAALKLAPRQRADLACELLTSLDQPDAIINTLLRRMAIQRMVAQSARPKEYVSLAEILANQK